MMANAVLFDLDDTLYPYSPCRDAGLEAARKTAREFGYDFDRESFEDFYQTGRTEVKRELSGTAATHERFIYFKRALEELTDESRPGDALALGDAFWEAYLEEMTLFPAVEETLETLQSAGIDVAITTNLTTRIQLAKVEKLGLEPYIDLLLTSEETGREKPGSVMFTLPLARLECRPSEAVMVGDDVEADILGANAVGLETVLWNADPDEPLEGRRAPDHRIDAFEELTEVVL
ncbi:HAD family hydrolase [Natronorubrum daqingense]|uniref:Hydrolase n=1 Tax=Natronorubrum daqingense TaxID=588898 RepID=A0A1N7CDT2_9EURY|nr:HAD family hydrolase [Natronorubrum daqingense]APX98200.1 hydrolase [Natronorubrum daqingense]SIR61574.1 putative hydrolase of the HAD superfamily [Natronorubrum daqingense]